MSLATNTEVNAVLQYANRNKEKIEHLQTVDFGHGGFQNMFVY